MTRLPLRGLPPLHPPRSRTASTAAPRPFSSSVTSRAPNYTARWDGSGRWEGSAADDEFMLPEKYGQYFRVPNPSRVLTKILCTLGPNTSTREMVTKLINSGMSAARLNTAHGDYDSYARTIDTVRQVAAEKGVIIPIILDTKGPEIRVGEVEGGATELLPGCTVTILPRSKILKSSSTMLGINYTKIGRSVKAGDVVLLDNGRIALSVGRVLGDDSISCRVINGGTLKSNKGVNLPGCPVDLPHVTEKDVRDVEFAVNHNIEYIAHSFTRSGEGIRQVRSLPGVEKVGIRIMAKIESQEGLDNFDEILDEADGVMVARGDLGVEIPLERVCSMQKRIIRECNMRGKFVVTATEMLESMIHNVRPTRAEASDVANSVLDGTDCVMLSGETAVGSFPVQSVQVMSRICKEAELDVAEHNLFSAAETINVMRLLSGDARGREYSSRRRENYLGDTSKGDNAPPSTTSSSAKNNAHSTTQSTEDAVTARMREAFAKSAVSTAHDVGASVIFAITRSGETPRVISKYRPNIPVIALSVSSKVCAQISLYRSVKPVLVSSLHRAECLPEAIAAARRMGLVKDGTRVLLLSGIHVNHLESFVVGEERIEIARSKTLHYIPGAR